MWGIGILRVGIPSLEKGSGHDRDVAYDKGYRILDDSGYDNRICLRFKQKKAACTVDTIVVTIQVPKINIIRYRSFFSLIIMNKRTGTTRRILSAMTSLII